MHRPTLSVAVIAAVVVASLGYFMSGVPSSTIATAQQPAAAGPLRHVVLFKFKDDATEQQIQEIVTAFAALPKKIEGIAAFEWGTNNSPEGLAEGFTHCFVVSFKDTKARDAYLPHPAHQEFVGILRPRLDKVLVVDYFAKQ